MFGGVSSAKSKSSQGNGHNSGKADRKALGSLPTDDLSSALAAASKKRMVHKSVIVRVAVERLLNDLEVGQLQVPLRI